MLCTFLCKVCDVGDLKGLGLVDALPGAESLTVAVKSFLCDMVASASRSHSPPARVELEDEVQPPKRSRSEIGPIALPDGVDRVSRPLSVGPTWYGVSCLRIPV